MAQAAKPGGGDLSTEQLVVDILLFDSVKCYFRSKNTTMFATLPMPIPLNFHEIKYDHFSELETFGLVWAVQYFRPYLLGHHCVVTVVFTDHSACFSLLNTAHRWKAGSVGTYHSEDCPHY